MWSLDAVLLGAGFCLWAFVFAWHERFSGRPVLDLEFRRVPWAAATAMGFSSAALAAAFLDPVLRSLTPEVYPVDFQQWAAQALFAGAFAQLFVCFAPMAFFLRLLPSPAHAAAALS